MSKVAEFEFGTGKDRDTFGYQFISSFYLFGKIDDETGYIKSLHVTKALMLKGADRKAEAQAAAAVFLMVIRTLSPELNADERAEIIQRFSKSSGQYTSFDARKVVYSQSLLEDGKILMLSATIK